MKKSTGWSMSGRRPRWRDSACALIALLASVLLVPAGASAAPASEHGARLAPVQLTISFIE